MRMNSIFSAGSIVVTERYLHLAPAAKRKAVELLARPPNLETLWRRPRRSGSTPEIPASSRSSAARSSSAC